MPEQQARRRVLFLCTHNSARSQMAEGLLRHLAGDRFEVMSAGTEATSVRPEATRAMAELGVDISGQSSKALERYLGETFDYVVTVCDDVHEACPVFPGRARMIHRGFDDPPKLAAAAKSREEALCQYARVRDEIKAFIEQLPEALRTEKGDPR